MAEQRMQKLEGSPIATTGRRRRLERNLTARSHVCAAASCATSPRYTLNVGRGDFGGTHIQCVVRLQRMLDRRFLEKFDGKPFLFGRYRILQR